MKSFKKYFSFGASLVAISCVTAQKNAPNLSTASQNQFELTVGGEAFLEADLPLEFRSKIFEVETVRHEELSKVLNDFALRVSLSKDKGTSSKGTKLKNLSELLSVPEPQELELRAFYDANKDKFNEDTSFEKLREPIKGHLMSESISARAKLTLEERISSGKIKISLIKPANPLGELKFDDFPATGNPKASIVVVQVSDYLCPHCISVEPEIEALTKKHSNIMKFIHVNLALNPTGKSGELARAAYCAFQQGTEKYWEFHKKAFASVGQSEAKSTTEQSTQKSELSLEGIVEGTTIDVSILKKCVPSETATEWVEKTGQRMSVYGVKGTPTFFLNGKITAFDSIKELLIKK